MENKTFLKNFEAQRVSCGVYYNGEKSQVVAYYLHGNRKPEYFVTVCTFPINSPFQASLVEAVIGSPQFANHAAEPLPVPQELAEALVNEFHKEGTTQPEAWIDAKGVSAEVKGKFLELVFKLLRGTAKGVKIAGTDYEAQAHDIHRLTTSISAKASRFAALHQGAGNYYADLGYIIEELRTIDQTFNPKA